MVEQHRSAPRYPGYAAAQCNGCGVCCLAVPCSVSRQLELWRDGRCRALRFDAGRYWCDVIANPRRLSTRLAKISDADRRFVIGAGVGCDHRAAWTLEDALEVLRSDNLGDRLGITGQDGPTYPRGAVLHRDDGTVWMIYQDSESAPPTIQLITYGETGGPEVPIPLTEYVENE